MRALIVPRFGGPDVLEWRDVPEPEPGAGEIAVRVSAVGLAWTDLVQMAGEYAGGGPQPPYIPGWEFAGRVIAQGPEVEAPGIGTRVFGFLPRSGALAEVLTVAASMVDLIPDRVADVEAAAFVVPFLTADAAAVTVGRLAQGEIVLVNAAAGGVGSAAVQLARAYGAGTIVATAGSEERRKFAAVLGADVVCGYEDIADAVDTVTGRRGVDLVVESVGGAVFDRSLEALAPLGRLVSVGVSGGERPAKLKLPVLWHRAVSVSGVHILRWLLERPDLLAPSRRRVRAALAAGTIRPTVGETYSPDSVPAALDCLRGRRVAGRVVIDFESPTEVRKKA